MPFLTSISTELLTPIYKETVPAVPTYAVVPGTTTITESNSITFTITTTNVPDGTVLYWTTSGTTSTDDFSDSLNSGSITINTNTANVTRTLLNNPLYEGSETIVFELRTDSTSGAIVATASTVTVNDAAATYSVSPSAASANEGSTVTWTITTTNVADGTTLYWTNSGTTVAADFSGGANSGSFTISSNSGTFSLTLNNDVTTETSETIVIQIRTNSTSGTIVATSSTVTIADTSQAPPAANTLLYTWGSNGSGQLGTLDTTSYNSPVLVQHASSLSWTMISTGGSHTMAIRSDGKLFAWGANNRGQLGTGNTTSTSSPVQIGNSSWVAVSAGKEYTVAIRSGGIMFTWGSNDDGQLGTGNLTQRSSPATLGAGAGAWNSRTWNQVSAGNAHVIAFSSSLGDVYAWGAGYYGQLGTGSSGVTYRLLEPTTLNFGSSIGQVIAAQNFSMIRTTTGGLWVVGEAGAGQLGLGNTTDRSTPVQLAGTWSKISAHSTGTYALGIKASKLFAWGSNASGQLGLGNTTNRSSPVQIGADNWTDMEAGANHVVAIRSDGTLWTWGDNTNGQLGDGSNNPRSTPGQVGSSTWARVDAGNNFTAAVRT